MGGVAEAADDPAKRACDALAMQLLNLDESALEVLRLEVDSDLGAVVATFFPQLAARR